MEKRLSKVLGFEPNTLNYLYALCDYASLEKKNLNIYDFINLSKKFDIKILQYRDKINSLDKQKENLLILKENLQIPIIINDKIDLIAYADGIHLGQEDLFKVSKDKEIAVKLIRKKIGNKLLGISTHNEIEILETNNYDIDMIGLGAYKSTLTKDVDNFLGDKISYLAKLSKHFVCAIGGVSINEKIENIHFNVVSSGLYK